MVNRPISLDASTTWTLWVRDTFDRSSVSSPALSGTGIEAGLIALWRHVLCEGVDDTGQATFSWFTLQLCNRDDVLAQVDLPAQPFASPGLSKLRRWTAGSLSLASTAATHARLLEASDRWTAAAINSMAEAQVIVNAASASQTIDDLLARFRRVCGAAATST